MLSFSSVGNKGGYAINSIRYGSSGVTIKTFSLFGGSSSSENNSAGIFEDGAVSGVTMRNDLLGKRITQVMSDNNKPISSAKMAPYYGWIFEDASKIPADVLTSFNNYSTIYTNAVVDTMQTQPLADANQEKKDDNPKYETLQTHIARTSSMFNPYMAMTVKIGELMGQMSSENIGANLDIATIHSTTELKEGSDIKAKTLDLVPKFDVRKNHVVLNSVNKDVSNCSIRELVRLSQLKHSILGRERYRYADFMYCKDLGKVSNNHLLTLRKFGSPVGDHIGEYSSGKWTDPTGNQNCDLGTAGDIGRLVAWFGTGDNKLEDIMKYDVEATWKEFNAKIQEIDSQEDDAGRGPLGMLLNSMNPSYNRMQAAGFTGAHNLVAKAMGMIHPSLGQAGQYQGSAALRMSSDPNRIYEPRNTIKSTHQYEGTLKFAQEFTLTFSYKLRAYANVNPKVAMLDLLGNILNVTYRRGSFWGGATRMIGPPANTNGWKQANNMIDNAWDKLGGIWTAIANGNFDFGAFFSSVAAAVSEAYGQATEAVKGAVDAAGGGVGGAVKAGMQALSNLNKKYNVSDAMKGQIKNALGRPAMYAAQSSLSGSYVGLWHLTIGNPKNPIAAFGNLIMTKATIQHSGPLGIDDFPTELKVTCTLKHGRPRDLTEIESMYTDGLQSIHGNLSGRSLNNYFKLNNDEIENLTKIEIVGDRTLYDKTEVKAFSEKTSGASAESNTPDTSSTVEDKTTWASLAAGSGVKLDDSQSLSALHQHTQTEYLSELAFNIDNTLVEVGAG